MATVPAINFSFMLKASKRTDYHKRTSSRPYFIPQLGLYSGKMFMSGNHKLDKSMLIFDLLAVDTCLNCSTCKNTCYALKSQRQYTETFNARQLKTWLAVYDLPRLEALICDELRHTSKKIVRIHSSGDFFSQDYINMWCRIAEAFPHVHFYSYTKVDNIFDFRHVDALKNFNVVRSLVAGKYPNYGSEDYITSLADKFNAFICSYGIEGRKQAQCGVACKACLHKKYVLFKEH